MMQKTSMIQGKAVQRLCVSPVAPRSRVSAVVRATSETRSDLTISRREAMLASVAAMSAPLVLPSPSYAGLFNDDDEVKEQYVKTTTDVLAKVQGVLALPKEPKEAKDAAVASLRKDINTWVATYRREPRVSGRPSYGNTYSALNALAGHFNNFGSQAPIPKKRLERLVKELDDASLFLSRGR